MSDFLEPWRLVFRQAVAPSLSTRALEALAHGLRANDSRLIQGATAEPIPMYHVRDWPCEGACALGYAGWADVTAAIEADPAEEGRPATVFEVEEGFSALCFAIDQRLGEPSGCRHFLNYWDETPREKMFPALLAEVVLALDARRAPAQPEGGAA